MQVGGGGDLRDKISLGSVAEAAGGYVDGGGYGGQSRVKDLRCGLRGAALFEVHSL